VEKQAIELAVGGRREENFTLTPLSTREETEVAELFKIIPPAPTLQVDTVSSSVSVLVEESQILELPLESRNIYSLFLLQPGVTSQGAALRGLSFSVHGQRVLGSNYMLDGVDNNNTLLSGPLAATSAEAVQEFRMVKSSFSAENGRATAFLAQVVTRSGSNVVHGSVFEFLANDKLNANTFQNNSEGVARAPFHQNQFGYSVGGPIRKNQTFLSSSVEFSRLHFGLTMDLTVPSAYFIASLPKDSTARRLLTEVPPISSTPTADPDVGFTEYQAPNRIDSLFTTQRVDHNFMNTKDRLTLRSTLASTEQFGGGQYSPGYPSLEPTDHFRALNSLLGWTHSFDAGRVNRLRAGWSWEQVSMPRPRSDIPILESLSDGVWLPGSIRLLNRRENNHVISLADNLTVVHGRSTWTAGFEYRRNLSNGVRLGLETDALGASGFPQDGIYFFQDLRAYGAGQPIEFLTSVDRFSSGHLQQPDLLREYRSSDYAAFVQDDFKLNRRLSFNVGLRYEYFGVLHNTDPSQDVNFFFGRGTDITERLANGSLRRTTQNSGDLKGRLYRPDLFGFAPSFGLAWDPLGKGRTVLRAGYALALDRVFDTVRDLRTNNEQLTGCGPPSCTPYYFLLPAGNVLSQLNQNLAPAQVVQLDENLRTPRAQDWYGGIQQTITPNLLLEVGHAGSVGRKLISRDLVNRSAPGVLNPFNTQIAEDTFLSNAANSNYLALEASLRQRFSHGLGYQVSYTYSHAIDNQSDILEGVRSGPGRGNVVLAGFTRQFDARADRGNANFDQRHNLVFNAIWGLPLPRLQSSWLTRLLEKWTMSVIAGYRSGFPVTVIGSFIAAEDPATGLLNNRADYTGKHGQGTSSPSVPGGVQWMNPNDFVLATDHLGNLGRGAIQGPGSWNYDFALLRSIGGGESRMHVQLRAEFYNLFNHANLSFPDTLFTDPGFGQAFYGVNPDFSRFGELPLDSPARRIQLGIRIRF
jgi:hypothetical protein